MSGTQFTAANYPGLVEADCLACATEAFNAVRGRAFLGHPSLYSKCGNKRCPCTAHHDNPCTGSNEPGQAGSLYP